MIRTELDEIQRGEKIIFYSQWSDQKDGLKKKKKKQIKACGLVVVGGEYGLVC